MFVCFFLFKTSPHVCQSFGRMLQSSLAVKLEKCSVDDRTSFDFPSAWGRIDNDYILIFR